MYTPLINRYEELQYLVCEQTDMNPVNQLLLYDNKHFSSVVAMDQPASTYPSSTPRCPLALFSKQDDDVTLTLPETPGKYDCCIVNSWLVTLVLENI